MRTSAKNVVRQLRSQNPSQVQKPSATHFKTQGVLAGGDTNAQSAVVVWTAALSVKSWGVKDIDVEIVSVELDTGETIPGNKCQIDGLEGLPYAPKSVEITPKGVWVDFSS